MQRDMGLVRAILLAMEGAGPSEVLQELAVPGRAPEEVWYHLRLMHEAGLIEAAPARTQGQAVPRYLPRRITWAGHDFLDAARSDAVWARASEALAEVGGTAAFETVTLALNSVARRMLGMG